MSMNNNAARWTNVVTAYVTRGVNVHLQVQQYVIHTAWRDPGVGCLPSSSEPRTVRIIVGLVAGLFHIHVLIHFLLRLCRLMAIINDEEKLTSQSPSSLNRKY